MGIQSRNPAKSTAPNGAPPQGSTARPAAPTKGARSSAHSAASLLGGAPTASPLAAFAAQRPNGQGEQPQGTIEDRARNVETILSRVDSLPTLSPIATRLLALTSSDDSDFSEIVSLIEADVSLTARMLALCRRASTGVAETVTTVRRAVVLLGLEAVQSAILSVSVFDVLTRPQRDKAAASDGNFDRVGFWQHSIAVACCAELLARQHPELKVRPDEAFTAGLVHDLGKVALEWVLPQAYPRVLDLAEARSCDLAAAERQVLGLDHHVAGKRLAEHWGLPYCLADTMWLHGQPTSALPNVPHRTMIGLVTAADALCRRMHLGWSGNCSPAPGHDYIVQCVELEADRVSAIEPRLHEALAQRCADLGLADLSSPELMMQSIASANGRLHKLTQTLARRAQAARGQAAGMELLSGFITRAHAAASVEQLLSAIAWSIGRLTAAPTSAGGAAPGTGAAPATAVGGPLLFIWQTRSDSEWSVIEATGDGQLSGSRREPAPGQLGTLIRDQSMAAAADMLKWVNDLQSAPRSAASVKLDLRRLRRLPLMVDQEAAVVLVHDRDLPEAVANACGNGRTGNPFADALTSAWAWAAQSAVKQAGSRRISEALAHANRALIQTQRELAETQSMARLGELTAGAAHEMNNPLTIISGRAQLLVSKLADSRDKEDARAMAAAASQLTNLITGLHELASPPAPQIGAVNVRDLIEQSAKRVKTRLAAERPGTNLATIRLSIGSPMDLAALDATLMGRVIDEVLANALQADPKNVTIAAVGSISDDRLTITIADDGIGMSDHALRHAFDPFFSDKPAGRRTGLGLPIARRFVGLHGGDIALRSTLIGAGKGTTAVISIPRWRHRAEALQAAA